MLFSDGNLAEERDKIGKAADKVLNLLEDENLTCDQAIQCLEDCQQRINNALFKKCAAISSKGVQTLFESYQH